MEPTNLTHHFLIAMPSLQDPFFAGTLIYLANHTDQGALGVILNRPMELDLQTLFDQLGLPLKNPVIGQKTVLFGGPVQTDRGFVLHHPGQGEWSSSLTVEDSVSVTSSRDILQSIGEHGIPADFHLALGHAGWGPGQLEQEIARNDWLTVPADLRILFETDADAQVTAALHLLGIDLAFFSETAGHA